MYLYNQLKKNPGMDMYPRTFIFGAKASAGYRRAKAIIKLINSVADVVNNDASIEGKIKVVFIENYRVSNAEIIFAAADVSEQISTASKEASGTGNMKFMLNGALTLGTMDGANVEMYEEVGADNIFIFGMSAKEVDELWKQGYNSTYYYNNSKELRSIIATLKRGFAGKNFENIANYLLTTNGIADRYMCLADFDSYCLAHDRALTDYQNKEKWSKMALHNIANAGAFSSDRAIEEYAKKIWGLTKVESR